MKKIIGGKLYNTDTARRLASWDNGEYYSSFDLVCEALYQKKTGEFFIYGEGGARTKYAKCTSNLWSGGEAILPVSYEDARKWAEEHISADMYEEIFGKISEDDSRACVNMSLSVANIDHAKRAAAKKGITLSAYIDSLIIAAQE